MTRHRQKTVALQNDVLEVKGRQLRVSEKGELKSTPTYCRSELTPTYTKRQIEENHTSPKRGQ